MSVRLLWHTHCIYLHIMIYIKKDVLIQNNQPVFLYQLIHNLVTRKNCLISSNIESCYKCYFSYQLRLEKLISSSILIRSHLLHNLLLASNQPVSILSLWEDILNLVMALLNVKLLIICRYFSDPKEVWILQ